MVESVQCFGRKKTTVAITHYKHSNGLIEIDGVAIEIVQPEMLRYKACEPILLLGRHCFSCLDVWIRMKDRGLTHKSTQSVRLLWKHLFLFTRSMFMSSQRSILRLYFSPEVYCGKRRFCSRFSCLIKQSISILIAQGTRDIITFFYLLFSFLLLNVRDEWLFLSFFLPSRHINFVFSLNGKNNKCSIHCPSCFRVYLCHMWIFVDVFSTWC